MSDNPLGRFLQARRAELEPDTSTHTRRRVPGLRREEVALRAGVSVDYYTRIEQGRATEVSAAILGALADALQLDAEQRIYLDELSRPATTPHGSGPDVDVLAALVGLVAAPAAVVDSVYDILAGNDWFDLFVREPDSAAPANLARFVFLDPRAREVIGDWELAAHATISRLHHQLARRPGHRRLHDVVRVLSRDSGWFAAHWNEADMGGLFGGPGVLRHGDLTYAFDLVVLSMSVDADRVVMVWVPAGDADRAALAAHQR